MTSPFYIDPEQLVRQKSDYARKGIARGRSVVVMTYAGGIALIAENRSPTLHKVAEIYDRLAFAAVGRYNEFENLRVAGVRLADLRGYSYDRRDVTGRSLANAYAQTLGSIFIEAAKPYEVEIVVAEVGRDQESDQLYRLTYDGSVTDERGFVAMGGSAEAITTSLREHHRDGLTLEGVVHVALTGLEAGRSAAASNGAVQPDLADSLEVAILDRAKERRTFRRITGRALTALLDAAAAADDQAAPDAAPVDVVEVPDGATPPETAGESAGPGEPGATDPA